MADDGMKFKTKICLLGDSKVGKTSLIRRFVMDRFSDDYISTLGTKVTKKEINLTKDDETFDLTFMIWDVEGTREKMGGHIKDFNASLHPGYIKGSEGIILVFDRTRKGTLEGVNEWYKGVVEAVGKDIPFLLLGNKSDLKNEIMVSEEEAMAMGEKMGFEVLFTSAKTGNNVEDAFNKLGYSVLKSLKK